MAAPDTISIVVRLIRNFEYRTVKNLVMRDVPTSAPTSFYIAPPLRFISPAMTIRELKHVCLERVKTDETFARFRAVSFDTIKKYTTFQGFKVRIINIRGCGH